VREVRRPGEGEYTEAMAEEPVRYPQCSDEDLAQRPAHGGGETGDVRRLMHYYHLGLDFSGLSLMMLSRLQQGDWTCPVCGASFPAGTDPRKKR